MIEFMNCYYIILNLLVISMTNLANFKKILLQIYRKSIGRQYELYAKKINDNYYSKIVHFTIFLKFTLLQVLFVLSLRKS